MNLKLWNFGWVTSFIHISGVGLTHPFCHQSRFFSFFSYQTFDRPLLYLLLYLIWPSVFFFIFVVIWTILGAPLHQEWGFYSTDSGKIKISLGPPKVYNLFLLTNFMSTHLCSHFIKMVRDNSATRSACLGQISISWHKDIKNRRDLY